MSAFLGHIHYWLYHKIRLVIEREQLVYETAAEACGETAEELQAQVWQSYGQPLPDSDLSELIEHGNIHGWLQRQINIAESREAALIKELLDNCGPEAEDWIRYAFTQHGERCGRQAVQQHKYETERADGIFQALNDYLLNGMPCDQADSILVSNADTVVWESSICLQEPNWKRAGASGKIMKKLYQEWTAGFVQGINPDFYYSQTADTLQGDPVNRQEIVRG
ncbi:hypothetical protein P22_3810 [Propionispora sp. 2/2-37]|uniref:hypothetical protein n=1 Tax=Propionispora sp. 2/2-37 TaxID=1677858 RepID=UPI0006BB5C21|nr:hypothetical protein [Propionispora sp. 2/2-37]CUH97675.1 hypothetical protein P22_3810 [Propionispora sp. 2/2-37]